MAGKSLSNTQKKEFAKTLYFNNKSITNKEIALRVDATEKTVGKWIAEGEWEILRRSMLLSKSEQIARLYKIMDAVTTKIEEMDGVGDTKLADMMIKYTAAIKNLETDTSIAEIVDSMMALGTFTERHYPEHFKLITEISDAFVNEKMN